MFDTADDDNLWREDLFAILGVTDQTSKDEIRNAYKALAKKHHPDKFPANSAEQEKAKEAFARISKAYDVLTNDQKRNHYLDTRRLLAHHLKTEAQLPEGVELTSKPVPTKAHTEETNQFKKKQADEFYQSGQKSFKKGKMDEAITAFKQAIELVPSNASYHSYLGQAYQNKGWQGMAQASYRQALILNPRDAVAKANFVEEKKGKKSKTTPPGASPDKEEKSLLGGLFGMFKKK